jgi:Fur family ferric uptake transcriptional regulator
MEGEMKKSVRKLFSDYLEKNKHRKTSERFEVLSEVYAMKGHFDVEHLFRHMKNKKSNVSRATIYNTIELLLDCNLIMKHQFGKNLALYEKSHAYKQHDHLICDDCEHVFEFCDPRIQQIQSMMGDILKFNITHHSLHLFGKCRELITTGICPNKKGKV